MKEIYLRNGSKVSIDARRSENYLALSVWRVWYTNVPVRGYTLAS
jgi:hypothetical protein